MENIIGCNCYYVLLINSKIGVSIIGCHESPRCNNVEYGEVFEIEKGNKYCFTDGNYFIVEEMKNEFCPCGGECIWEGEMILKYSTLENGNLVTKTVGSSAKTDSTFISSHHFIRFVDIITEKPCNKSNPSPKIKSTEVVVR